MQSVIRRANIGRRLTRYASTRTANWTKVTCRTRETFVVAGIAYKQGKKFDGIYLARRNEDGLLYAGKVENGFTPESHDALEARAKPLFARTQPLTKKIRKPKAQWLKPEAARGCRISRIDGRREGAAPLVQGN
jgi:bifunctional non-homologous end joining protein LigD